MSLRGGVLRLLALRGRFEVEGRPQVDVELQPGLTAAIGGTHFTVAAVVLPSSTLGLELPRLGPVALPPVASLRATPQGVELHPGFLPDAEVVVWYDGEAFRARPGDGLLQVGEHLKVGPHRVPVVSIKRLDSEPTDRDPTLSPLRLTLRHDTVHITHDGRHLAIDGRPAQVLTELGLIAQPVEWRVVARELWPDEDEDQALRRRWDRTLARLRGELRRLGLREDLVRLTGAGRVELFLHPHDTLEDQT